LPFFRIALWIVPLVSAMLLPFLPGRHDPLAASLSVSAVVVCFGGLLLIPIGAPPARRTIRLVSAQSRGPECADGVAEFLQ
jgi:hypothetical protein